MLSNRGETERRETGSDLKIIKYNHILSHFFTIVITYCAEHVATHIYIFPTVMSADATL